MNEISYTYVFVRTNMLPVQVAVQACHAVLEMARDFNTHFKEHPHLLLFGVKEEKDLREIIKLLTKEKIGFKQFIEPDLDNSLTALATWPIIKTDIRRVKFRKYKLLPLFIHNK